MAKLYKNFKIYCGDSGTRDAWIFHKYDYSSTTVTCGRQNNPDTSTYNYTYRYYYICYVSEAYYGVAYVDESTINMRIKALRAGFPDIEMSAVRVAYGTDSQGYKTATIYGYSNTQSESSLITGSCVLNVVYYALDSKSKKIPQEWANCYCGDNGTRSITVPTLLSDTSVITYSTLWTALSAWRQNYTVTQISTNRYKYTYSALLPYTRTKSIYTRGTPEIRIVDSNTPTVTVATLTDVSIDIHAISELTDTFEIIYTGYCTSNYTPASSRLGGNILQIRNFECVRVNYTTANTKTVKSPKPFNIKSDVLECDFNKVTLEGSAPDVWDEYEEVYYHNVFYLKATNDNDVPINITGWSGSVTTSSGTYSLPAYIDYYKYETVIPAHCKDCVIMALSDSMDVEDWDVYVDLEYPKDGQETTLEEAGEY